LKELDNPKSGKLGNTITYHTRYGQVTRQLIVPRDPKTPTQLDRRTARARFLWRTLTDQQHTAWNSTARGSRTRRRLNQSGPLSGYLLFIKINCNLAAVGLPMVTDPPAVPRFGPSPVGTLTITNSNGVLALKLSVAAQPAQYIVVLGAKPCSAGVTYEDHFTILGLLPDPDQGLGDISELYLAKFPVVPVGSRVFIKTYQLIDGWEDLPRQTSHVVPAP
jgi:hypothetical protein